MTEPSTHQAATEGDTRRCKGPGCTATLPPPKSNGKGGPRLYCSGKCKTAASRAGLTRGNVDQAGAPTGKPARPPEPAPPPPPAGIAVGPRKFAHLEELAAACRARGIRQLWVPPDELLRLGLPTALSDKADEPPLDHPWFDATSEPLRAMGRGWVSVARAPAFALVIPSWDPDNPWHVACRLNPPDLLGAQVVGLYRLLGVPWHRSGALTSDNLIRHVHGGAIPLTTQPPPGERGEHGRQPAGAELPLQTWRAPEGDERKARYCHVYDRHGQFLAAASSLPLGTGEPEHVERAHVAERFAPKVPGYWLLRWPDGRERWHTTPAVRWELAQAPAPELLEAWVWPTSHQWLEKWYRTLREARTHLLDLYRGDETQPPVRAVKAIYQRGIGRLGSVNRSNLRDPLYQPYWRHAVIAEARTRLRVRLANLAQQPVAVDVDAGYWLTNTRDPIRFANTLGLPLGSGLGDWSHERTIPGDVMRDALNARNPLHALHQRGETTHAG